MTYTSTQVTVGTTAVRLDSGTANRALTVRAVADVFIGGSSVTSSNGVKLKAGEDFADNMTGSDGLYAIAASGTVLCYVLQKV
jgi:hypothetical protein